MIKVKMKALKRRRETDSEDEADGQSSEGYATDIKVDLSRRSKAASGKREARKNITQRRSKLENDEWVKSGTTKPNQLTCKGCNKAIRLHPKRQYDSANWQVHKTKCPNITGAAKKRVLDIKKPKMVGSRLCDLWFILIVLRRFLAVLERLRPFLCQNKNRNRTCCLPHPMIIRAKYRDLEWCQDQSKLARE